MIGGIATAGIGMMGAFNKRKNAKYDSLAPIQNTIDQGATSERGTASGLVQEQKKGYADYQKNITDAVAKARADQTTSSQSYVQGVGDTSNRMFQNQAGMLKQNQLDSAQAAGRLMRNNLAAGGNLNSGAGVAAAQNLGTTTANNIAQGMTTLGTQSLAAKQKALADTYNTDSAFTTNALGINESMYTTLMNSGREDLINEANQLLEIQRNQTNQTTGIQQAQLNRTMANRQNDIDFRNERNAAIFSALGSGASRMGGGSVDGATTTISGSKSGQIEQLLELMKQGK